jgi:hypothetical protein
MLGDPLQLIVIFGRGSALAWDIKFLTAKFVFCIGFGLLILRLLGNHGLSLIYAVLAAYCGANYFFKNHPVFFVYAYAPWILLSALQWLDPSSRRQMAWGVVWLLVNFSCFNGGHIEVAVDLIGELNLTAMIYILWRYPGAGDWRRVTVRLGIGTLLFLGLTAPTWVSFLVSQAGAFSVHTQIQVRQIPLVILPGMFDDIFYLLLREDGLPFAAMAPGSNLIFLSGTILALLKWRQLKAEPFFWINSAAILACLACVYAPFTIPVLEAVPFLNRVGHLSTDFSYLLILHLAIQSAFGFRCLLQETDFRAAARRLLWVGAILEGLLFLYCSEFQLAPFFWGYILSLTAAALAAPWLFAFLKSRYQRLPLAGWVSIMILGAIPLWRFGLYHAGNDQWLMIPGPRETLNAPSPAIQKLQARVADPFRVAGLRNLLWGDYAAVYGLEDIRSCAPLSNAQFVELVRDFPGIFLRPNDWQMRITDPVRAQPLLNLLNVRFMLAPPGVMTPDNIDLRVIDRSDFGVVENPEAWPRAFFDNKLVSIASNQEFVHRLLTGGRQPFIALTPEEIGKEPALVRLEATNDARVVPASHYHLGVNATAFDIHAPSAGVVCLTEGQAKDFTVRINDGFGDRVGRVLTVNRAFKGVYLDRPGDYHITFTYRPRYWTAACLAFWLSLFFTGLIIVLKSRTKNQPTTHG